jgi:Ca-activated chloride channel family protein
VKPFAPSLVLAVQAVLALAAEPTAGRTATSEPTTPGALAVLRDDGVLVDMPLRHTSVRIEVSSFVARATVEQTFANPFQEPVEAVYTFPLGDGAAVDDFEFVIGDRVIRGQIRRREEARRIYETARAEGYRAALLEQERPNIFTQSVANIEPGKSVRVRIRTFETLRYEKGAYEVNFPLVVGPRYVPGGRAGTDATATTPVAPTPAVPDAPRVTPPVLRPGYRSGHDVDVMVELDAGVPVGSIASPSHRIAVERLSPASARVALEPGDTIPNNDFILRWNVSSERPAVGLLAHRSGLDGFFALLVQPKGEIDALEAAPKEIVFVLDTSGSMSGPPIEASKRFIRQALRNLGPRDTFNLVRFAGDATTFSEQPRPNEDASIRAAQQWIQELRGEGGTEMLAGFRNAFALAPDPDRIRLVIFLTDGYIGNEHEILGAIAEVLGDARIFTLGIGSSVNHYLLDRMALLGRGAYTYVRHDEDPEPAIERFRDWVTRPYLTDLEIDWGALPVVDLTPERPRDLFNGQTLTVVGRYLAAAQGAVTVRGRLGGRHWEQSIRVALPERDEHHAPLAALWARKRIDALLMSSPGGATRSIEAEVTALALEYRLMSPFTSFVAVDDSAVVNPSGAPRPVHQALPIPEGVSFEGVFGPAGPQALRAHAGVLVAEDQRTGGEFIGDLPVPDRFYQNVLTLTPGAQDGDGAGTVHRSREGESKNSVAVAASPVTVAGLRQFREEERRREAADRSGEERSIVVRKYSSPQTVATETTEAEPLLSLDGHDRGLTILDPAVRLLDAAFRILADLAEDGRLSGAEGRPSLAALLAAQTPEGAIAERVVVHAIATWALLEAAAAEPNDPWVVEAAGRAEAYLPKLATPEGWPQRPGGPVDAEATRWALLALSRAGSGTPPEVAVPGGTPSEGFVRLRAALATAKTGERAADGRSFPRQPFERLLSALPGRRLRIVGTTKAS